MTVKIMRQKVLIMRQKNQNYVIENCDKNSMTIKIMRKNWNYDSHN